MCPHAELEAPWGLDEEQSPSCAGEGRASVAQGEQREAGRLAIAA
jgi:hypothetical protein